MKNSLKKIFQNKWTITTDLTPSNVLMKYRNLMHFTSQYNFMTAKSELFNLGSEKPFVGEMADDRIYLSSKVISYWTSVNVIVKKESNKTKVIFHFRRFWFVQLFILVIYITIFSFELKPGITDNLGLIIVGLLVYSIIQLIILKIRQNVIAFIKN